MLINTRFWVKKMFKLQTVGMGTADVGTFESTAASCSILTKHISAGKWSAMRENQLRYARNCLKSSPKRISNVSTAAATRPLLRSGASIHGRARGVINTAHPIPFQIWLTICPGFQRNWFLVLSKSVRHVRFVGEGHVLHHPTPGEDHLAWRWYLDPQSFHRRRLSNESLHMVVKWHWIGHNLIILANCMVIAGWTGIRIHRAVQAWVLVSDHSMDRWAISHTPSQAP
jgi:hypothetical protein